MKFENVISFGKFKISTLLINFSIFYFQLCPCWSSQFIYTNEFAVQVVGGDKVANELASRHGFMNRGQIGSLKGYYLFEHARIKKRSTLHSETHLELLKNHPSVLWTEQQHIKHRVKRDLLEEEYAYTEYPDPLYPDQWFLHHGGKGGYDMNVLPAWAEGYTGKGIVVSILDDGIQTNHPDLAQNYDKLASRDINGQDDDPTPQDNGDNNHGTRCAGEVAAVAFNNYCGIGIAYNASIGGVRMLDGTVTDSTEAAALGHNPNHIHIYSASWGPEDDGTKVDGPGPLAKAAFLEGITNGRSGLGSIFVWASGNGGRNSDSCNCDGYTNSIYTLSISSATQRGTMPWYLERCSSTLATTYSSGTSSTDKNIATVDVDNSYLDAIANDRPADPSSLCTKSHTGTSASAPIAAGICALALEANPNLTWRDMQYLVLITSRPEPLKKEQGWVTNGVNRLVSSKFGYGLMDAAAIVKLAKRWTTVPEQHICETAPDIGQRIIPNLPGHHLEVNMNTTSCKNMPNAVTYLEHVQVKVTLYFKPRGNLKIVLISPAGTPSTVLLPRTHDLQEGSFNDWPFMSVHFWGENSEGTWKLIIVNDASAPVDQPGKLIQWSLIFYGTSSWPINLTEEKRTEHRSPRLHSLSYEYIQDELYNTEDDLLNECSQKRKFKLRANDVMNCVDKCPNGYFANNNASSCIVCDKSCTTCYGPSNDNCMSCSEKFYLSKNFCDISCPNGYYPGQGECLPCSQTCLTCQDPDSCLLCRPHYFSYNHKCVPTCPRNAFLDNNVCRNCHSSCASCYGESPYECLDCLSGSYMFNVTCIPECPSGFYANEYQICTRCPQACKTCVGDRMCTSCFEQLILSNGECVIPEDDKSCSNEDSENCNSCPNNCTLCENSGHCIHCQKGYYWSGHVCTELCPNGFFSRGNDCHKCPHMCQSCTDHHGACTICEKNLILFQKNCLSFCPTGFRLNGDNICEECDFLCARCKGRTAYDCTLCKHGYLLLNNTCHTSCPDGYFPDKKNLECLPCYHMCKTCSRSGRFGCTSCPSHSQLTDGLCIPCLENEYLDRNSNACFRCHNNCVKCNGPSEFNCLSCRTSLNLDQANHSCLPCCKENLPKNEKCCSCSKVPGICISSAEHPRSIGGFNFDGDLYEVVIPMNHVVPIVVAICASAVILFVVLFGILQAHSYGWCRFRYTHGDYKRVPSNLAAHFDAEMEAVSLTQGDPDEEDEIYEKA